MQTENLITILSSDEEQEHSINQPITNNFDVDSIVNNPHISEFQVCLEKAKQQLEGTEETKTKLINKRLNKYFNYGKKISIEDGNLQPPIEPDYRLETTVPVLTTIILYGTDLLGVKKLKNMFKTQHVRIINESNCRIQFTNQIELSNILQKWLLNPLQLKLKVQDQMIGIPHGWMQLKPYPEGKLLRKLKVRYATNLQINLNIKENLRQTAEKQFQQTILDNDTPALYKRHNIQRQSQRQRSRKHQKLHQNTTIILQNLNDKSIDSDNYSNLSLKFKDKDSVAQINDYLDDIKIDQSMQFDSQINPLNQSLSMAMDENDNMKETLSDLSIELRNQQKIIPNYNKSRLNRFVYAEYMEQCAKKELIRKVEFIPID